VGGGIIPAWRKFQSMKRGRRESDDPSLGGTSSEATVSVFSFLGLACFLRGNTDNVFGNLNATD